MLGYSQREIKRRRGFGGVWETSSGGYLGWDSAAVTTRSLAQPSNCGKDRRRIINQTVVMSVAEREKHSKVKHIEKSSRHESHESRCYCSGLGLVSKNTPLCFFVSKHRSDRKYMWCFWTLYLQFWICNTFTLGSVFIVRSYPTIIQCRHLRMIPIVCHCTISDLHGTGEWSLTLPKAFCCMPATKPSDWMWPLSEEDTCRMIYYLF